MIIITGLVHKTNLVHKNTDFKPEKRIYDESGVMDVAREFFDDDSSINMMIKMRLQDREKQRKITHLYKKTSLFSISQTIQT